MSEKHQSDCYRTIKGERYVNYCDVLGPDERAAVALVKSLRIPHRLFKHSDGFSRLFVREADLPKLEAARHV